MIDKIKVFFEIGNFVITLQDSLKEVKSSLSKLQEESKKLNDHDLKIAQGLKFLNSRIDALEDRIGRLESTLMAAPISSSRPTAIPPTMDS